MVIGYACGVFDMFHIGHLNLIKNAKANCDYLIIGVTTDELCLKLKGHKPAIPYSDRCAIVSSIKYVDEVVPQVNMNKPQACAKYHASVLFAGDDHKDTKLWKYYEKECKKQNISVVYFPYTQGISSTILSRNIKPVV